MKQQRYDPREVFLKDTLDAAQNDAEQLVVDRLRDLAKLPAQGVHCL